MLCDSPIEMLEDECTAKSERLLPFLDVTTCFESFDMMLQSQVQESES